MDDTVVESISNNPCAKITVKISIYIYQISRSLDHVIGSIYVGKECKLSFIKTRGEEFVRKSFNI